MRAGTEYRRSRPIHPSPSRTSCSPGCLEPGQSPPSATNLFSLARVAVCQCSVLPTSGTPPTPQVLDIKRRAPKQTAVGPSACAPNGRPAPGGPTVAASLAPLASCDPPHRRPFPLTAQHPSLQQTRLTGVPASDCRRQGGTPPGGTHLSPVLSPRHLAAHRLGQPLLPHALR